MDLDTLHFIKPPVTSSIVGSNMLNNLLSCYHTLLTCVVPLLRQTNFHTGTEQVKLKCMY